MALSTFATRLKQARSASGLSQKQLGIEAGIDEFTASTRMNRYEQGVHEPDAETAKRIAVALGVPSAYLFADDEDLAELIRLFPALKKHDRDSVLRMMRDLAQS
jgi:transcriptional regulator with XRE-family HTH domain